jgi:hypothetical protein
LGRLEIDGGKFHHNANAGTTEVDNLTTDPEINGSNPAATRDQDKMMYKSFLTMPMLVPYHSCFLGQGENDVQIIPHNANAGTTVLENITICTENNG